MTIDDKITDALNNLSLEQLNLEPPVSVDINSSVYEAVSKMDKHGYGCVLVNDADVLTGIFTERDILLKLEESDIDDSKPVREFMAAEPVTLSADDKIVDAVREMSTSGYRHLPIMDSNGKCMGILTARMIVDFVVEFLPEQVYNLPPSPDQNMLTPEGG